jgi:curved DNA-binding protein CbpA
VAVRDDPFALLGLPPRAGLTDDDVRAGWRRIAAATHPDREDGGDPARFGAAAAAYVLLRTSFGRGEALADLADGGRPARARRHARPGARRSGTHRTSTHGTTTRRTSGHRISGCRLSGCRLSGYRLSGYRLSGYRLSGYRLRPGRPGASRTAGQPEPPGLGRALGLPVTSAATVAAATMTAVGITPATIGLLAGALTVTGWALWRRGGWGQ